MDGRANALFAFSFFSRPKRFPTLQRSPANVKDQLADGVQSLYQSESAFAALKSDDVIAWGHPESTIQTYMPETKLWRYRVVPYNILAFRKNLHCFDSFRLG